MWNYHPGRHIVPYLIHQPSTCAVYENVLLRWMCLHCVYARELCVYARGVYGCVQGPYAGGTVLYVCVQAFLQESAYEQLLLR